MYDPGGDPPNLVPQQPDNLNFGLGKEDEPLWFLIQDSEGTNDVTNLTFREAMVVIPKLLPEVSDIIIDRNTRNKSIKKYRDEIIITTTLGNKKCKINEIDKLNHVKGIINHTAFSETTNDQLFEDLKSENPNIVNVHIFSKFDKEKKAEDRYKYCCSYFRLTKNTSQINLSYLHQPTY